MKIRSPWTSTKAQGIAGRAAGVDGLEIEVGVREAQERIEIAQSLQNTLAQVGIKMNITVGTGQANPGPLPRA